MTADVTPAADAPAPELAAPRDRPTVRRLLALLMVASWLAWAVPACPQLAPTGFPRKWRSRR
ncbi:hypothetical protein JNB_10269 [Janibacter sp. HTCC2649]|uniref:hypothetical protein n=1 Tax=Janibacter sp. HTCC2649 TaxID=313589 RepID=UPI0000670CB0|nr:hypothetical protein [Janibacter sp. HTCC2649]EAQ00551.1 hypothetical protein JNB_10269 [Janibacter sp. HTCC2649]